MASRGPNVQYTLQAMPANTHISTQYLQQLCNIARVNFMEYRGAQVVWDNPEMYNAPATRLQVPAAAHEQSAFNNFANIMNSISTNTVINVNFLNSYVNSLGTMQNSIKSLFTANAYAATPVQQTNSQITVGIINNIVNNLNIISDNFDSLNYWWNQSNDLCVRSCQTACQSGCMVSCQSCYTSTCHNQNCGGWS